MAQSIDKKTFDRKEDDSMGSQKLHDFISDAIRKHHNLAVELSDDLYAHPELPDQEFRSSAKMVDILLQAGYEVEYQIGRAHV